MTPQSIILLARYVLNDRGTSAASLRQSNDELVGYVNQGLREIAAARADLFSSVVSHPCADGKVDQALTFATAQRVLDVLCITDGAAITPMDRFTMDQFRPTWRTDPAGPAEHWAPLEADPLRFFIYPPAPSGQHVDVRYARLPAQYALEDAITELPESFEPVLADYVIYRSESKDDEHVLTERAAAHYTAFKAKLGSA
ncbi:hypothetical protein BN948_01740 [Hydrogenophaga intermedia]|uniref:Uncharacterized protein n=1 Tax=Hydrogenophaga intermedia TaxID=65786 RepID=A0A1L1PCU4_HYDIT|nr:DUF6682 family protein [Hydrogenophaga intermedia]CDN87320.1 hypothetical protein BN948_01740 [Hydrogenophaga intermedia]